MPGRTTSDPAFHYVYVLESSIDGNKYVGMTKDLRRRLKEHNGGESIATRSRRPLALIYYEAGLSYKDAATREKYYKTTGGRRSLAKRLRDYMSVRNPKLS